MFRYIIVTAGTLYHNVTEPFCWIVFFVLVRVCSAQDLSVESQLVCLKSCAPCQENLKPLWWGTHSWPWPLIVGTQRQVLVLTMQLSFLFTQISFSKHNFWKTQLMSFWCFQWNQSLAIFSLKTFTSSNN